jgi:hypothetical protein
MELDYPKESLEGQTERSVATKALENAKLKPSMRKELEEKLKPPDIPDDCAYIWEVFWDLFRGERMTYADILAYSVLYNIRFTEFELDLLHMMDSVACKFVSDQIKAKNKQKPKT